MAAAVKLNVIRPDKYVTHRGVYSISNNSYYCLVTLAVCIVPLV